MIFVGFGLGKRAGCGALKLFKRPARFCRGLVPQRGRRPDIFVVITPEGQLLAGISETVEDLIEAFIPQAAVEALNRRCCTTLTVEDSQRESIRLDGLHEQAITRPLPHDKLVQLHCLTLQARFAVDLAGQGHDLARAA